MGNREDFLTDALINNQKLDNVFNRERKVMFGFWISIIPYMLFIFLLIGSQIGPSGDGFDGIEVVVIPILAWFLCSIISYLIFRKELKEAIISKKRYVFIGIMLNITPFLVLISGVFAEISFIVSLMIFILLEVLFFERLIKKYSPSNLG